MRIKLSEEVFGLIKELSRTEKAYLKKRSFGKEGSKLEAGFDIISAAKGFDEKVLSEKLKRKGIDPKEVYKRLLPIVLKSLSQYHAGSTPEIELNEIIIAARLLVHRKQKTLGLREIERGITLAKKHDHFAYLVELYRLRQAAQRISFTPNSADDELSYNHSLKATANLETSIHYNHLYKKVVGLIQSESISKPAREQLINDILNHPSLFVENPATEPYQSFIFRMRIQSSCYYFSGRWEAAIATGNEQLNGMPNFNQGTDLNKRNRLVMLGDLGILYHLTYDRTNYLKTRKTLESAKGDSALFSLAQANLNIALSIFDQNHAILSGHLEESLKIGNQIIEQTDPSILVSVLKKGVMSTIVLAHFYQGNHLEAIQYVNTEFPFSESDALNSRVRWLELICWFYLNDEGMFESKWRSWNRQLKKMNLGYDWEFWIMKGLKSAYGKPTQKKKEAMQMLQGALLPHTEELRTRFLGFFDFLIWTESIIQDEPMMNLVKEKYLAND